jgi:transposase InsO family protein
MKWIYECFGISKQAFYKRLNSYKMTTNRDKILIKLVKDFRKNVGQRTGGLKLYSELKNDFKAHNIKIGRDRFFIFLRENQLLVTKLKNYHITTNSNHRFHKYKNLVSNFVPTAPEQLWVTDITYIKTENGHNYLALVTDAYSKKIMGYCLDNHMKSDLCINALNMAVKNRIYDNTDLIHHSDRGFQYCSTSYVNFAQNNKMTMSMTEQYDPYENAIAERINRTLKYEYGLKQTIKNTKLAKKIVKEAVNIYNNLRPHLSLEMRKPSEVHQNPNIKYKSYRKNKK